MSIDKKLGAIWAKYKSESDVVIKKTFSNYNSDVFVTDYYKIDKHETTYTELIFKDGKLISATGNPNDKENNAENNVENNTDSNIENNIENNVENNANNNAENNTENNIENNVDNNEENVTKLPQTGEETNAFAEWLTIAIFLMIFWFVSMLLIDHEKKKMTKK